MVGCFLLTDFFFSFAVSVVDFVDSELEDGLLHIMSVGVQNALIDVAA